MAHMRTPQLIAMSGLPGSGKSTVAEGLARHFQIPILSIDPAEAAMWASGLKKMETGNAAYQVVQALAAENLKLGTSVVIDAVNPVEAARDMWRMLAAEQNVPLTFIEVVCSDQATHRERIESRVRGIAGMSEVTWNQVQARQNEYEPWRGDHILLDSFQSDPQTLIAAAIERLA